MQIDGEKLRRLREEGGMTQEKLAAMSRVNERTIQRAEAGATLSVETVAQIAAAVGKQARDLRLPDIPNEQEEDAAPNTIVLHRTTSARDVLALYRDSFDSDIECDVEPTASNVEKLAKFADALHRYAPDPMPSYGCSDKTTDIEGVSLLARRLRITAEMNSQIQEMANDGAGLFIGSYMKMVVVPKYDVDEGFWYTKPFWKPQPVRIATLRISAESADRLVLKVKDAVTLPEVSSPPTELADSLDEEIPF